MTTFALILTLLVLLIPLVMSVSTAPAINSVSVKLSGPQAKKAYEAKVAKCQGEKAERCKWLVRSLVYYDCMDAEDACAYEAGKNGCMKQTLDCIRSTVDAA